ncbi:uncharacterized protein [Typha angustifolia]|uniref:uncharacterized protein n=1 Tax=Typha angustifolia TaxID=59011 RepID=UPI003C2E5604
MAVGSVVGGWFASSIVSNLITSLISYVKEDQSKRQLGLKAELKRLEKALPKIQAVMDVVDSCHIKEENPELARWLWQFRDAVNEAEDFIDEMDYYQLEEEIKGKKSKKIHLSQRTQSNRLSETAERLNIRKVPSFVAAHPCYTALRCTGSIPQQSSARPQFSHYSGYQGLCKRQIPGGSTSTPIPQEFVSGQMPQFRCRCFIIIVNVASETSLQLYFLISGRDLLFTKLPSSLKALRLYDCSPELKERCLQDLGPDWPKIQHIPTVQIGNYDKETLAAIILEEHNRRTRE